MASIFSLLSVQVLANSPVSVSAIVGNLNKPTDIKITSPAYLDAINQTEYLESGSALTINLSFTDTDSTDLYYTITPSVGAVSEEFGGPISNSATLQFTYLSPTTVSSPNQDITIAVNDGSSVASKVIKLYIY